MRGLKKENKGREYRAYPFHNEFWRNSSQSYDELSPDVINKIDGQHLTAYQVHDNIEDVRKIAEENKDDLRKIKLYFWLAVLVLGIIVFPIARHQVTQAWKSGVAQDFLEGVDPATRQPTNP